MMLRHLDEFEAAQTIEAALLTTLEQGKTTRDIAGDEGGALSTTDFTEAIVQNFGRSPVGWAPREYRPLRLPDVSSAPDFVHADARRVVGVDVFVESPLGPEELGPSLERLSEGTSFRLKGISNRGTVVYPPTGAMTDCIDQWFCRFLAQDGEPGDAEVFDLVGRIGAEHRWMHLEKLQELDGDDGFTKAQGED
jgi:isocitrate dehydrogenase